MRFHYLPETIKQKEKKNPIVLDTEAETVERESLALGADSGTCIHVPSGNQKWLSLMFKMSFAYGQTAEQPQYLLE